MKYSTKLESASVGKGVMVFEASNIADALRKTADVMESSNFREDPTDVITVSRVVSVTEPEMSEREVY